MRWAPQPPSYGSDSRTSLEYPFCQYSCVYKYMGGPRLHSMAYSCESWQRSKKKPVVHVVWMETESSANEGQGQDVSLSVQLVWAFLEEHLHEEWVGTKCIGGAWYVLYSSIVYIHCLYSIKWPHFTLALLSNSCAHSSLMIDLVLIPVTFCKHTCLC